MDFPAFEGALRGDAEALARASRDFGRHVSRRPLAVLYPASYEDVRRAVAFAFERKIPVVARGQGHTTGGQAQAEGGLVIDLSSLARIDAPRGASLRCQAGATWLDVVTHSFASGLTPPVLTDYLGLSVGGTLSVGGVGGQSHQHGAQVDQVRSLLVVTGQGELVEASAGQRREVFDLCRAGLGRGGIILEAELALVEAPERVRVHALPYADLGAFLQDQARLAADGRFDYLLGNFFPAGAGWGHALEAVSFLRGSAESPRLDDLRSGPATAEEHAYLAYVTRLSAMVEGMRERGSWEQLHPWIDVFLPATRAEEFIARVLGAIAPQDVGDGFVLTYPMRKAVSAAPLFRLPDEPVSFLFDVLPSVPAASIEKWVELATSINRDALAVGGTIYPIGSARLGPEDWRRHFGPLAPEVERLRAALDPGGILGVGTR